MLDRLVSAQSIVGGSIGRLVVYLCLEIENGSEEDDTERIPRGRCHTLLRKDESFRIAYIMAGLPLGEERVWLNLKSLHVMQQIASGHKH